MIKESELILSDDKKIYHLGLNPEQIGHIIITVGDPQRVPKVSKYFDKIEFTNQKREFISHTGLLGNKKISVIGTGIGPDNIDIMLNEVDALHNIDFNKREIKEKLTSLIIVRLGTSGTIRREIDVDSTVVSSHGLGMDGLMNFYDHSFTEFQTNIMNDMEKHFPLLFKICKPYIFPGSEKLIQSIGNGFISGITLTAGGFYGPQGRKLRLDEKINKLIDELGEYEYNGLKITNFEMETSAIYGLSQLMGHQALSFNTIIANRATGKFSSDPYKAVEKMIQTVMERIDNM